MKKTFVLLCAATLAATPALAVELFSDSFDVDTSASWNILTSSPDNAATFAFDYSLAPLAIPPSPNGGGSTIGLKMESNMTSGASNAITLTPTGQSFSGVYQVTFDMWMNAVGPFPGGGAGSTEFLTAGIGHDDVTVNRGGATGAGGWFAPTGEGGSSRDYRAYKNAGEQFAESGQFFAGASSAGGGAHNSSDPYYAGFGAVDVGTLGQANATQTGVTQTGSQGFAWHEVSITVFGTTATWAIDGLPIAQLDTTVGSDFPLTGNIAIGYMDIFTSVAGDSTYAFGLIDNLVVTDVPEPSTLALCLLGLGALLRRR